MGKISRGFKTLWDDLLWGIIFIVGGAYFINNSLDLVTDFIKENQEFKDIKGSVERYDYNKDNLKAIVVEYTVKDEVYSITSKTYSQTAKPLGTTVALKYNPNDPEEVIFAYDLTTIMVPLIAAVFVLLGILIFLVDMVRIIRGVPEPVSPVTPVTPAVSILETPPEEKTTEQKDAEMAEKRKQQMAALRNTQNL